MTATITTIGTETGGETIIRDTTMPVLRTAMTRTIMTITIITTTIVTVVLVEAVGRG